MMGFNVCMLLALGIVLQDCSTEAMSFSILKALISPPMPRVTRIRNISPRDIRPKDPSAVFDFLSLVKEHGYPAEEHNVTTTDGYKLILHRIPGSPTSPPVKKKPIVLIQHGFLASSDTLVLQGPGKDLAFILADAGFDVWVPNFRGNTYSRSHVVLKPEDPAFWQFSQHDVGYYDLPAFIDYALETTGLKNLTYIGHSMGTTTNYILLSTRPEYNERIRLAVSLAPIAFWKHELRGWQKVGVENGLYIEELLKSRGIWELAPQSTVMGQLTKSLCSDTSPTRPTCVNFLSVVAEIDSRYFDISVLPQVLKYFPAGGSLKTLLHYYQNLLSGDFRQYDYGYVGNFQRYRQKDPPAYNVSKITAPVALFFSNKDVFARPEDVKELENRLPNVVASVELLAESVDHFTFVFGERTKEILYDDVVKLVQKFN